MDSRMVSGFSTAAGRNNCRSDQKRNLADAYDPLSIVGAVFNRDQIGRANLYHQD
jgi:hypothetical protein